MIRLDHLAIPVRDHARSREWYTRNFGFRIEFEVPERKTVALQDDSDLTLFLIESPNADVARVRLPSRSMTSSRSTASSAQGASRSSGRPKSSTGGMEQSCETQTDTS